MRWVAERVNQYTLCLTSQPGWLRRLLGAETVTYFVQLGEGLFGLEGWFMGDGTRVSDGGMIEAIRRLPPYKR